MSAQCEVAGKLAAAAPMSLFERGLTLWVALCIVVGVLLGVLVLSETFSWHEPAGAALVLLGILLTQRRLRLPGRAGSVRRLARPVMAAGSAESSAPLQRSRS